MIDTNILILNLSYAMTVLALILRDVLWLRAAWTGGQVCMIAYGLLSNEPVIMAWNAIFLAINGFQVVCIIRERQDVPLSTELAYLHKKVFPLMSKREFLNFWNKGKVCEVNDERIVRRGEPQNSLFLIVNGNVTVKRDGRELAQLGKNCFFAEMSFLTGSVATADVTAVGQVKFNAWDQAQLRDIREANPELYTKIQSAVSLDLVHKMKHGNKGKKSVLEVTTSLDLETLL